MKLPDGCMDVLLVVELCCCGLPEKPLVGLGTLW